MFVRNVCWKNNVCFHFWGNKMQLNSLILVAVVLLGVAPLLVGISCAKTEYKRQAYRLYTNKRDWWDVATQFIIGWFECVVAEAACLLALSIVIVPLYYLIWGV